MNALNIKAHPHNINIYYELFYDAFKLKKKIKIFGDRYGLIGSCHLINPENRNKGYWGELFFFTDIDPAQDWFNIENEQKATVEELRHINIPSNLKPHLKRFMYVFFPGKHRLIYEIHRADKSISSNSVKKLFHRLLISQALQAKYDIIDVIIEQSIDNLDRILNMKKLTKLIITLTRPNSDTIDSFAEKTRKRLDEQNIGKSETTLSAKKNESLIPDQETKKVAILALSDGLVEATGYDELGFKQNESTIKTPQSYFFEFDTSESFLDVLINKAKLFLTQILNKDEQ